MGLNSKANNPLNLCMRNICTGWCIGMGRVFPASHLWKSCNSRKRNYVTKNEVEHEKVSFTVQYVSAGRKEIPCPLQWISGLRCTRTTCWCSVAPFVFLPYCHSPDRNTVHHGRTAFVRNYCSLSWLASPCTSTPPLLLRLFLSTVASSTAN